jgi:hypothetical protein
VPSFDAGTVYSNGPWAVGANMFHSVAEGAAGGDENELLAVKGAVS